MTITPTPLAATPTFPAPGSGSAGSSTGLPDEPYTIRVVDMAGTVLTELPLAFPGDIIETLNAPDEFDFHFHKSDYTRDQIDVLGTIDGPMEVQILLGTEVLAWGPVVSPEGSSSAGLVRLNGAGVDWYWTKRNVDRPPDNLLPNAGFEDGLTGWTEQAGVTATIESDLFVEGTQAVRLTQAADAGLGIISDPFPFSTGRNWETLTFTVSFILEEFLGPALFEGGIVIEAGPIGGGVVEGGVNADRTALYTIDHTTPVGVEVRVSLQIRIPPHASWGISVTLFGPKGSIVWDAGYFVVEKVLSTLGITGPDAAVPIVDVSHIVRMLATQALTVANFKSDLRIALELPNTFTRLARSYAFADHIAFDQALAEFWQRDDCFDYGIRYTATTRTLVLYPIVSGPGGGAGQGTDRSANITLGYGIPPAVGTVLVASFVPAIDGGSTVTQAAALGDGSGGAREERWASGPGKVGGTILQAVVNAPVRAPLNSLEPQARAIVAQRGRAPEALEVTIDRLPTVLVDGGPLVILQDHVQLGDILTVDIRDGYWTFSGKWRIVRRARHCRARTMTYTLNRIVL